MQRQALIVVAFAGFVLAGLFLFGNRVESPAGIQPVQVPQLEAAAAPLAELPESIQLATEEYENAKTSLRGALDEHAIAEDDEFLEPVKEDLGFLDRAVMEITMALAENPDNQSLQETLLNMYDEQVSLLRKAVSLVSGSAN